MAQVPENGYCCGRQMQDIKVVNIGSFGHFGEVLDELVEIEAVNLAAYAPAFEGEDISSLRQHRRFGGAKCYESPADMLAQERPDIAVISTRPDRIAAATVMAAEGGCNLIVEKPLAIDTDMLQRVFDAVSKNKVRLAAMLSMRSLPAFVRAREIYESGELGTVVLANVRKSYRWGIRPDWFGSRQIYGGTIPWIGIHAFDILNYITGQNFAGVFAMHSNLAHPAHNQCEDNCVIVSELSNGTHATISLDYCRPDAAAVHGDDYVRIVGTDGILEANASRNICTFLKADKEYNCNLPQEPACLYQDFIRCLRDGSGKKSELEKADPFMLTHVSLCARQSADTGGYIKIRSDLW